METEAERRERAEGTIERIPPMRRDAATRTIAAISRGNGDNDNNEKREREKKGEFIEARLDPSIFG